MMMTSKVSVRSELLTASDEVIEDAVQYAEPMVLRGLLYQLTGDASLKAMELKQTRVGRVETVALSREEDVAQLRRKTVDFLKNYRAAGAGPIDYGPRERLPESLSLIVGHPIKPEALDLMVEETALDPWVRSLKWKATPDPKRLQDFTVTIIGAGMGGLNAAVQLKRAGIRYSIIEKNSGVGGTWFENRYPGARVDTPSRSYTNLYGVDFPCPYVYGTHVENQKYYDWVAYEFNLRGDITFNTEVRSLTWDESAAMWEVRADGPKGEYTVRSNAVITGVGFLNRPYVPDFEGMADFKGQSWHTARWPDDVDLRLSADSRARAHRGARRRFPAYAAVDLPRARLHIAVARAGAVAGSESAAAHEFHALPQLLRIRAGFREDVRHRPELQGRSARLQRSQQGCA
jgi:4-hydroxyacetophenone monooxygenase